MIGSSPPSHPPSFPPVRPPEILLPDASILVAGTNGAVFLSPDGEITAVSLPDAARIARGTEPIMVHGPALARRLGLRALAGFDILDLFAFVLPGQFCLPTPGGVIAALGQTVPSSLEDQAMALAQCVSALLGRLVGNADPRLAAIARRMTVGGWSWGPGVLAALGVTMQVDRAAGSFGGLDIWDEIPEWEESPPPDPPGQAPVFPADVRKRLADLVRADRHGGPVEERPQQADYASSVTAAFLPPDEPDHPALVLAEAGTGVGKTLGYLAPASLWAERNGAPVWISTYTRNLQNQIEGELDRLYPDPAVKAAKIVIRKGRENYLCLLNYDDLVRAMAPGTADVTALGLMARWALVTRDGALNGGDFPGWIVGLMGRAQTVGLADRRGECIYSACPHYKRCFIETGLRRARRADIVVANHALVMVQAALGGLSDGAMPQRYVFDEGHHLFEAADSAFAAQLSGLAAQDLRRWILGAEGGIGRARGLRRRIEDLVAADEQALADLQAVLIAAAALPGEGWAQRIVEGEPRPGIEQFLALVRQQVMARAPNLELAYDLEADRHPLVPGLAEAGAAADTVLAQIETPLKRLVATLGHKLDDEADALDSGMRGRIEAMRNSLTRRAVLTLAAWRGMLADLDRATPDYMVDWFSITRLEGRDLDVGLHRHWIDPTVPFIAGVVRPAHGVVVTSATLTDGGGDAADLGDGDAGGADRQERGWRTAEVRSGARHLGFPPVRARVPSPFDYAGQTRAFIVTDVRKDDLDQVAAAYRTLFLASQGGGLGLFTAISRLRAVYERIAGPLDAAGIALLAQHLDGLDVATLLDIFRAEEDACLLGTDAVRDGVDVPGRSLRLIVFDRVPWPRPDILHKARRGAFGGRFYDDMLTRLKLRQAFGRLIRRAGDKGVFVLLDPMMPTRLAAAFPPGVTVRRVGLAEAVAETAQFLAG